MRNTSRGLGESVVHGLAKVGLVWALTVLGTVFVVSAAYGADPTAYAGARADASSFALEAAGAPRTIGLALALLVLTAGLVVLAIGAAPRPGPHVVITSADLSADALTDDAPPAPAPAPAPELDLRLTA